MAQSLQIKSVICMKASVATRFSKPAHLQSHPSNRSFFSKRRFLKPNMKSSAAIEDEISLNEPPPSLIKDASEDIASLRRKFEEAIRSSQTTICDAVSELDGKSFREDAWIRPGGGGGITRILQDGTVWEKAGVNVSVVYGSMAPEAYRAATTKEGQSAQLPTDRVPFFAAGISSVMHPHNPHAPTMHFNYRYFETDRWGDIPPQWWFGGGTDITPSYVVEEDMKHFHGIYKAVCDRHDPEFYPRFKKWCDDYFLIRHRKERRGLGGIFFDDLNDRDPQKLLDFSIDCQQNVVESYLPLVRKHKDDPFTPEEKEWQQMRRGRYVEFNLVYDRGTTFGLRTGGRIESILMSLPLTARWEYDQQPKEGTPEAILIDHCKNPRDWV